MGLYLVGENLDKTRSHYFAETGQLIQLMRGIYVDVNDDIDTTVFKHALRIAMYLYPQTGSDRRYFGRCAGSDFG